MAVKTNTEKKVVKRKPKTIKERRFTKVYLENGGNATQAALAVYNPTTLDSAKNMGQAVVERLSLRELMEKREKLTDNALLNVIENGLEASKRTTSLTEPDQLDPDYAVRHKYLETTLKLKGHLNNDTEAGSKHYHVHMTDKKQSYEI